MFSLRVMSYNLRTPSDEPPHDWNTRRPLIAQAIARWRPDLIGTQEGFYHMVRGVAEDTGYHWLGLGREGGSKSEHMAVYYRRERFEPMAFDHVWLSDTPSLVGSATWGNKNVRMVTWALLREVQTYRSVFLINTHLDHESSLARQRGAEQIVALLGELNPGIPVVLTGDFNARPVESEAYQALVGEGRFADTWTAAAERGDELGSYHGWDEPDPAKPRIDWILTRGAVTVRRAWIDADRYQGQWPSDHFPVLADLEFG